MVDVFNKQKRSEVMSKIRATNTKPEIYVRKILHSMGFRFRLHNTQLPGKPDIRLPKFNAIIFVHGCFWHQHNDPNCKISRIPKSNQDYWFPKLQRNIARDKEHKTKLQELGWDVLVIWECQIKNKECLIQLIKSFFNSKIALNK